MKRDVSALQSSYDHVAEEYAAEYSRELEKKPLDRKLLDLLIEKVGWGSMICDMGCGPGQIAAYLHSKGTQVCGIDLSPNMVRQAQRLYPEIRFQCGDMLDLHEVASSAFAGIAAFYSIIHIYRDSVVQALTELNRVLRPSGKLLITFHIGKETIHRDEWWGKHVCVDFIFFDTEEMKSYLRKANFELQEVIERDPYPDIEYQSRRAYIFAKKL